MCALKTNTRHSKTLKGRLSEPTSILFMLAIFFYAIQAIIAIFSEISPPLVDLLVVTSIIIVAFMIHLKSKGLKKTVPIFLLIGFLFHITGLYVITLHNPYYVGSLYGAPQLSYHYDWIVHLFGTGFLALAFSSIVYPYLIKAFKSRFTIFLIILACIVGMGSLNEIMEFVGFNIVGYGGGFLGLGSGDFSPLENPWQNSCMDMTNNLIGGIVFIGLFMLDKRYGLFGKKDAQHVHR